MRFLGTAEWKPFKWLKQHFCDSLHCQWCDQVSSRDPSPSSTQNNSVTYTKKSVITIPIAFTANSHSTEIQQGKCEIRNLGVNQKQHSFFLGRSQGLCYLHSNKDDSVLWMLLLAVGKGSAHKSDVWQRQMKQFALVEVGHGVELRSQSKLKQLITESSHISW